MKAAPQRERGTEMVNTLCGLEPRARRSIGAKDLVKTLLTCPLARSYQNRVEWRRFAPQRLREGRPNRTCVRDRPRDVLVGAKVRRYTRFYSATYGRSPIYLALLIACASSLWCLAQTPLIRLGMILPFSVIYLRSFATSL